MASTVAEAAQRKQEALSKMQSQSGLKWLSLEEGENIVRLIPPKAPRVDFSMEFKICYNVGPNKKQIVPGRQFNQPSPAEDHIDVLVARGDDASKAQAAAMVPKMRTNFFLIPRKIGGKEIAEADQEPHLFTTNLYVLRDITAIFADPEYGDITDPATGVDITIHYKNGDHTQNGFPEWTIIARRKSSPLGTAEQIVAWTAEDLFAKYHIGEPSEPEYVQACLAGTEKEYNTARRESSKSQQSTESQQSMPQQQTTKTPPTTPGKPITPDLPGQQYLKQVQYPGNAEDSVWWVFMNGETVQLDAKQLGEALLAGTTADWQIMPNDQSAPWGTLASFGFAIIELKPEPKAPPAPSAPVTPPPPSGPKAPPQPSAPQPATNAALDEAAALRARLAEIQNKSAVSAELDAALK